MTSVDLPEIKGMVTGDWVLRANRDYPQYSIEKDDYLIVSEDRPDEPWLMIVDPDRNGVTVREVEDPELGEVRGFVVGLYRGFER